MTRAISSRSTKARLHGAEPSRDFPYYRDWPVQVNAGWLFVLAGVALGFTALQGIPAQRFPTTLVPAVLFMLITLLALAAVVGRHWVALFGRIGPKQIGLMVLFALTTMTVSLAVGLLVSKLGAVNPNPILAELSSTPWWSMAEVLALTLPQLLGEEFLAILPFFAVLWFATSRIHLSRNMAILVALVVSSALFGAAHLPTYGWNWQQALGIIGSARIVLTIAYVVTKNIWVSCGSHIINDWSEFMVARALSDAHMI